MSTFLGKVHSCIQGHYAFVTSRYDIIVLDISDLANISVVSRYDDGEYIGRFKAFGAFLLSALSDHLRIIDASDPETLLECGSYFLDPRIARSDGLVGAYAEDNLIYICNDRRDLRIYQLDVESPNLYSSVDGLNFEMLLPGDKSPLRLDLSNHGFSRLNVTGLYIADDAFTVHNEQVSLDPREAHEIEITFHPADPGEYYDSLVVESDDPDGDFKVPVQGGASRIHRVGFCQTETGLRDIVGRDNFIFGIDRSEMYECQPSIYSFDVFDPASPRIVNHHILEEYEKPLILTALATSGTDLITGWYSEHFEMGCWGGIICWDRRIPARNPWGDEGCYFGDEVLALCTDGSLTYAMTYWNGLIILDGYEVIGQLDFNTNYGATLEQVDNSLYIVSGRWFIVDVSDPSDPELIRVINEVTTQVSVQGNFAYGSNSAEGLRIYDVTDRLNPHFVSSLDVENGCGRVRARDDLVFVTSNRPFICRVIDVSDPMDPVLVDFNWDARLGFVSGDYLYSIEPEGLAVYDVSSINPRPEGFHGQLIPLEEGWNLISAFCLPSEPAMPNVWEEVVERGSLFLTKDQGGLFYRPGVFNNMNPWDVRQGYMVKMECADTMVIRGDPTAIDTPILLVAGWNMAAYFPAEPLEAPQALAGLGENLLFAKDVYGRFYNPAFEFSNMGVLSRDKGYQVKVAADVDLVWNIPEGEQLAQAPSQPEVQLFKPALPTCLNLSVLVTTASAVEDGLELTAVDGNGVIVAKGEFQASRCGLAVWGDDPSTPEREGLREGEGFSLMLDGVDKVDVVDIVDGEVLIYQTDSFSVVAVTIQSSIPTEYYLTEAYPNPFNFTARLTFGLPEAGLTNLSIYDLSGRLVASLIEGEQSAGVHSVTWNAEGLPSGIYLARLEAGDQTILRKLTLVK